MNRLVLDPPPAQPATEPEPSKPALFAALMASQKCKHQMTGACVTCIAQTIDELKVEVASK